ncbi:MAG: HAMP domain-containing histidine kinase [Roseburia sp.]|nr:HAMP domain-containing histidine kinase [Roseburia sp.]MCM1099357.1 HAMP domain-containing histidine kinase [Ruminococcus flavefaciens]
MRKPNWKRFLICLAQHLLAAGILLAAAGLLLNSSVEVESIDGAQMYRIFPADRGLEFEESEIYHDLFRNAVSDITQLVVVKRQLETDGAFDAAKNIDITGYAREIGTDQGCAVSAVYELDDLIKWGKYGLEYTSRIMNISDFVNYFGDVIFPENFALDEFGQLCFDGFFRIGSDTLPTGAPIPDGEGEREEEARTAYYGKTAEEVSFIWEKMQEKMGERDFDIQQLEDMVFAYIKTQNPDDIEVSHEDGSSMVMFPLINCRYSTIDGEKQLIRYANNWVDYLRLQNNLAVSIENLTKNFHRYQICNEAYREGRTNAKYAVRMMTDEGLCTYTNLSELQEAPDEEITEFFSEFRRYLIYYPDSLVFTGNTDVSEEELFGYISNYSYAYPDTTHIWLGVDTNYSVEGDAFYNANIVYERIVSNGGKFIALITVLLTVWLTLGGYLTFTAGITTDGNGTKVRYLNRFDRIWTELLLLIAGGFFWGGFYGGRTVLKLAGNAGAVPEEVAAILPDGLYYYGSFILYGLYLSLCAGVIWYSLVRRLRAGNLWRDSLLYRIGRGIADTVNFIFRHRNSVTSTLLPYNLFLFLNLMGVVGVLRYRSQEMTAFLILIGIVLFDSVIGVIMFKRAGEKNEIVEGINRIRDGEVDYKLDTDSLHGANRELADAVNNIGEGIRKAVKTSMKDEQMKTDLITNVSHDIKTPLTSIINYVDLLKRLKIEAEPAKGYIDILDNKAQRLKQLTDDLVEASKISSGNIELEKEKLNLTELIHQGLGEFSERMEARGLQVVFESGDTSADIFADSRRMWRVLENLLNNICKYAMENTRVYIDVETEDGKVRASVKNISKQQMNIRPEELTERFIRGDSARSTEGSGLGLSIAQSLVRAQGGDFQIYLDGDLFKVTIEFPRYEEEEAGLMPV